MDAHDFVSRPPAPSSLVFDHNLDSGTVLWQRLHNRWRDRRDVRLIVHLKRGATYVGNLVYFDPTILTISARGRQYEFWIRDLAHVLAVPVGTSLSAAGWE
ncbi:MAG: hypothetical protein JSV65_10895 [Armatimonadota bacterium]|nr:MAG: hypothetical protein JSV65_10895 [Armatimonadota bacterium]